MRPSARSRIQALFHSIRFELLVYYFSICMIVMALGSYLIYNSMISILQKRSEEYIYEQFKQSEYSIRTLQNEVERLLRVFLADNEVQGFLKAENIDSTFESVDMQQNVLGKINHFIDINNNGMVSSIYVFSRDMMIGKSRTRSVVIRPGDKHQFYTTGMYDRAWNSYPKPVWNAGITEKWFYTVPGNTSSNYIVSMALGAKPILEPKLTSVIVFNIDERDLCATYSKFNSSMDNFTYLVDTNGYIISSIRKEDIGKQGSFVPEAGVDFKSFNMTEGNKSKMILYYKINETGWYIVREIPMGLLQSDAVTLQKIVVAIFVISLVLIVGVSFFAMKRITDPLSSLASKMKDIGKGNLGVTFSRIPRNEVGLVITRFNEMSLNIRELVHRNTEAEREKKELEIEALQYQINPHFLYNTLNMIKWMAAVIKAENILDSVVALGNILRLLFSSNDPLCLVREEMSYLENYINIMNWRFSNKIAFRFDIREHLMDCKIIKFILQPVIENSVVHGTGRQNSPIDITIHIDEMDGDLLVRISDNGTGMPPDRLEAIRSSLDMPLKRKQRDKAESIGLCNVNRRIRLNFGESYGVSIDSREGEGTCVTIRLPKLTGSESETQ